ncbi:proline--tRNA ligase [Chitinivibrio alkaliphilus]|uniref:Proline--tRNA ligase n=1 Tax=Chitinivibrio alkaliphilus ACht1 TaxID=1313304 RepID=U7D7H0_9BACT|nr:proline--tRNA ligase [Chitinivibrio alkaliphilus]ERP38900.1 prolyl-tRNA synthetase [Chitinivibrio alkaliphilus ACht1]
MYWKNAFIYTLREDPSEAEIISHKLMIRAGMISKVSSGIYNYLPLGLRVIRNIERIIREEMEAAGAAELLMPAVVPASLWQESGRWDLYGRELLRVKDRKDNEFCIGPTHEEVVVDIVRRSVKSYKDLPLNVYQIQSKFRDEIRPRFGLMRGREFIMKDAYSFHASDVCLEKTYQLMKQVYTNIFSRFGLDFRPVEADSGAIGGDVTHEFHVLADSGEDKIIFCPECDYAANVEKAAAQRDTHFGASLEEIAQPEHVETPNKKTIDEVSEYLGIAPHMTVKMLVYKREDDSLVGVLIRGDLTLNEVKLKNHICAEYIELPYDEELSVAGLVPGYMGPLGLDHTLPIFADYSVKNMEHAVVGGNKEGVHTRNVSPRRDLSHLEYGDFAMADAGDSCRCGGTLDSCRGIEVGQVFKLQKKYTSSMGMSFLTAEGKADTPTMGCYGIGVGRTAAAAVEQNFDSDGIVWPEEIAPYAVLLISLDPKDAEVAQLTKTLHDTWENRGIDVLVDDRKERPGVKFKDADLIGIPHQIIIGKKSLKKGQVEYKNRRKKEKQSLGIDAVAEHILSLCTADKNE